MKKTAVIYESKYGSTRRYAQWIAEALSCPMFERKHFNPQDFSQYEVIVYGGGLYAGSVSGIRLIARNQKLLSGKKIVLFTCGLMDPNDPANSSAIHAALSNVLSPEMLKQMKIFHLRGAIDYSRLGLIHKFMMFMLRHMLLHKTSHTLSAGDRQILDTYGKTLDLVDSESIKPLADYVKKL